MPTTRSERKRSSSKSTRTLSKTKASAELDCEAAYHDEFASTGDEESFDIEKNLREALDGVGGLRRRVETLQVRNKQLEDQLADLMEGQDASLQPRPARKGGMSTQSLSMKIAKLSKEITNLERARERDRLKIKKLQIKEIERDAAELQGDVVYGSGDSYDQMRKLLRKFYTVISSPSIEEQEECNVCLEKLQLETAISLPCQHVYCKNCLIQNAKGKKSPTCPSCRKTYEPDLHEAEHVQFTATQQWDALLEVAHDWARIDKHGGEDEPEDSEEEEQPFIIDGDHDASSALPEVTSSEDEELVNTVTPPRVSHRRPATPPSSTTDEYDRGEGTSRVSYTQSPTSEKRKRLEELAAARRLKRRL